MRLPPCAPALVLLLTALPTAAQHKDVLQLVPPSSIADLDGDWKVIGSAESPCKKDDDDGLVQHWFISTSAHSITIDVGALAPGVYGHEPKHPHQFTGSIAANGTMDLGGPNNGDRIEAQIGFAAGKLNGELLYVRGRFRLSGQWDESCVGVWNDFFLFGMRGAPEKTPVDLNGTWRFTHQLFRKYTKAALPAPKPFTGTISHAPSTGHVLFSLKAPGLKKGGGIVTGDSGVISGERLEPVKSILTYLSVGTGDRMAGFGVLSPKKKKKATVLFVFTAQRLAPESGQLVLSNDGAGTHSFVIRDPASGASQALTLPAGQSIVLELAAGAWQILALSPTGVGALHELWLEPEQRLFVHHGHPHSPAVTSP